MVKKIVNGEILDLTAEELTEYNNRNTAWDNDSLTEQ